MNWYQLNCFIGGQQTLKGEVLTDAMSLARMEGSLEQFLVTAWAKLEIFYLLKTGLRSLSLHERREPDGTPYTH
jgi:hypothetical protein